MNKLKYIISLLLILFQLSVFSQRWKLMRYEVIGGLGTALSQNDIVGVSTYTLENYFGLEEFIAPRNIGACGQLGLRYRVTDKISLKASLDGGLIRGADPKSQGLRKFNTLFIEPSLHFEYSLIKEGVLGSKYSIMDYRGGIRSSAKRKSMNLYVFIGAGGMIFKPNVNKVIENNPDILKYEGLDNTIVVPAGMGIKLLVSPRNAFGLEIGARYTLLNGNDLIDGVIPAASKSGDLYGLIDFFWSYKLRTAKNGLPILRR